MQTRLPAFTPRIRGCTVLAKTQPPRQSRPLGQSQRPTPSRLLQPHPRFEDNTLEVEKRFKKLGGNIQLIVKKGEGHYRQAPEDPTPVVDFIARVAM
jgi:hypothetical protein